MSEDSRDAAIKSYELHDVADQIVVINSADQMAGVLEANELVVLSSDGFLITDRLRREAAALGVRVTNTTETKRANFLTYKRRFRSGNLLGSSSNV